MLESISMVVEAKSDRYPSGGGMAQSIQYAGLLGVSFAFSSNGDGVVCHDATASILGGPEWREIDLKDFPSPEYLQERRERYRDVLSA